MCCENRKKSGFGLPIFILLLLSVLSVAGLFYLVVNNSKRSVYRSKASSLNLTLPELPTMNFDAISEGLGDDLYFFKGNYVYKYQNGVFTSAIKMADIPHPSTVNTSDLHDVDAAVFIPKIQQTVLNSVGIYKGSQYWRWDIGANTIVTNGLVSSLPVDRAVAEPFPQNGGFDAIVLFSSQNKLVFYKGSWGWSYDMGLGKIVTSFPFNTLRQQYSNDIVPAFPDGVGSHRLQAAVQFRGNMLYYSGPRYYTWSPTQLKFISTGNFRNYISETYARYPYLAIITPTRDDPWNPMMATLTLTDRSASGKSGSYIIPYIQTSPNVKVAVVTSNVPVGGKVKFILTSNSYTKTLVSNTFPFEVTFLDVPKGEYTIRAVMLDKNGTELSETYHNAEDTATNIAVGDIIATIGDSVTDGYYGRDIGEGVYQLYSDVPSASPSFISNNKRNFPHQSPASNKYFESFSTSLNNQYVSSTGVEVFVDNEGWGGKSTSEYINTYLNTSSGTDYYWQERMNLLRPNIFLIQLGANDARRIPPTPKELYKQNLKEIIARIKSVNSNALIFLATPFYFDYVTPQFNYPQIELAWYVPAVQEIINEDSQVYEGPNFFSYFSLLANRNLYYQVETETGPFTGMKVVHPNYAGMLVQASMWLNSISAKNNTVTR